MDRRQHDIRVWQRNRQQAVSEVILRVICVILHQQFQCTNFVDHRQLGFERQLVRDELMCQINTTERCRDIIRMGTEAFKNLCEILKKDGGLQSTQRATIEEQVFVFLHIVSHNVRNRTVSFFLRRSGYTISHHFHRVLRALISLEEQFLRQPTGTSVPSEILNNSRFYPYFKVKYFLFQILYLNFEGNMHIFI